MTGKLPTAVPAGTPAERVRSLLVAARSLSLSTPGHRADLVGRHRVANGRLVVEMPAVSCMAGHLRQAGELVAQVEVTDLAPVPIRNRVRARASLTGWLTAAPDDDGEELTATLELAAVELVTADSIASISPEEFAAARPDPLADSEADLLCHLHDHHPEVVERLSRLVPPHRLAGVRCLRPLALDRFGLVLRLEHAGRDADVRLEFPVPLRDPDQVADAVEALLDGCPDRAPSTNDRDRPGGRSG